jgi:competence protein ComEC
LKDYPFIKFAVLFILGILLGNFLPFNTSVYFIISFVLLAILIVIFTLKLNSNLSLINSFIAYLLILLFGILTENIKDSELDSPLSKYQKERNATLYGEVNEIELYKDFEIVFYILTDSISFDNKLFITNDKLICKFRGDSLNRKYLYENLKPGNKIYLTGTYQKGRDRRNPGEFDYDRYLNSKGLTGLLISYDTDSIKILERKSDYFKSALFSLRKIIDDNIHKLHTPNTAALLRGLLLADRSEISYETKNEFINSGVIHILAVSGLHVGYILLIFIFVFGRFGIFTRSVLTIIGLLIFMFITGVPPSVFRATLMAITIIVAFLSGRSTNIINSVSIAAVIILLFYPNEIYNPGFQLSFSAVLAIALLYPYFQKQIFKLRLKHKWIEYILLFCAVSISAQLGTIPFTLAYFSKLSVVSIFANLIVIPAVGVIIANAFVTLFISFLSHQIASYFASANDLISWSIFKFIKFVGGLDFSFIWIRNFTIYDSIIFYLVLIALLFIYRKLDKLFLKILLTIIIIGSLFLFTDFDNKNLMPENKLSILMIDVGQGDSFLIKFPNGKTAIIDAGEANPFIDNGERVIIPLLDYLGIDKIDYGFISHLDIDHYGGFVSLIYNDRISEVYRPKPDSSDKSKRLEKFLKENKIKTNIYRKTSLGIGNSKVYILNDPDDYTYNFFSSNDRSGVLKIVYGKTSFLFVGDCEFPAEYFLASRFSNMLDSDVLKVGHHGSKTGSSLAFLNLVSPDISLISAGIKNKFNHPAEEVLNNLKAVNSQILRTDYLGAVLLQSDGIEIKIIDWKN